jgi:ribosomal protein S18 acetylase RimI-like enzyme
MNKFELREPTETEFNYWIKKSTKQQAKDRAYVNQTAFEDEFLELDNILPQLLPDNQNTKGHHFNVLDIENKSIGFVWFGIFPGIPADMIILMDIMLEEECRSKGYGRKILNAMHDKMKSKGYKKVYLEVKKDNYAKNLYTSLGYKIIKDLPRNLQMLLEL